VGLVGNDCKSLPLCGSQLTNRFQGKRKSLYRTDDDFFVAGKSTGQFCTLAATDPFDRGDNAFRAFETLDRFAQLAVDDVSIRNHNHGIKHFPVVDQLRLCRGEFL